LLHTIMAVAGHKSVPIAQGYIQRGRLYEGAPYPRIIRDVRVVGRRS
jgi:hypothetical protein